MIDLVVIRHVALGALGRIQHHGKLLRFLPHFDHVVITHQIGCDIHFAAVHGHMAMIDELARGKWGNREFQAVDHRIQPALQQLDHVFRRIALAANGFVVILAELLFTDVAVVAFQLLLGHQLN